MCDCFLKWEKTSTSVQENEKPKVYENIKAYIYFPVTDPKQIQRYKEVSKVSYTSIRQNRHNTTSLLLGPRMALLSSAIPSPTALPNYSMG